GFGELSRVAVEARAGARSDPGADERTGYHGVRVPDAAPQARRDRSAAERLELSAECDNRIPCDEYARGIHAGRTAGGHGSPRAAVERADAPQSRVCVRARVRPAQAAEDHSAARRALRFWSNKLSTATPRPNTPS